MTAPVRGNPLAQIEPTPRVRNAVRLYATGAVRSKRAASIAAGLHPQYLTMLTSPNGGSEPVKRLMNDIDKMLEDKTVDMSRVMEIVSRRAVGKIAHLMESSNENVALKAAQDLADRGPDTSKTQKVQVESFSLGDAAARELAAAMVESAKAREKYRAIGVEGLVEVDVTLPEMPSVKQLNTPDANSKA